MLIPKESRDKVYRCLFQDGVMVAKRDYNLPTHPTVGVRNLYVIKLLQSLKSKGYVTERFSWLYYYWFLTNEGIEYLREYLHLPDDVVPTTLKKAKVAPRAYSRPGGEGRGEARGRGGPGRGMSDEKKLGPQDNFKPEFRGSGRGAGRGRGGDRPDYRKEAPRPAGAPQAAPA